MPEQVHEIKQAESPPSVGDESSLEKVVAARVLHRNRRPQVENVIAVISEIQTVLAKSEAVTQLVSFMGRAE